MTRTARTRNESRICRRSAKRAHTSISRAFARRCSRTRRETATTGGRATVRSVAANSRPLSVPRADDCLAGNDLETPLHRQHADQLPNRAMRKQTTSDYIELGMNTRYLMTVWAGSEVHGDGRVVAVLDRTYTLLDQLGFVVSDSAGTSGSTTSMRSYQLP